MTLNSSFNKNSGIDQVGWQSDKPVLEAELNEVQDILNDKINTALLSLFGDGLLGSASRTIGYTGGTFTISSEYALVAGMLVYISSLSIAAAEGNSIYLKAKRVEINSISTIKKYGNLQEDENVTNNLVDSRVGAETTSRMQVQYDLGISNGDASYSYLLLGTITSGNFVPSFKTITAFNKSELGSTTDGTSGADEVGATAVSGLTGATVQSLIEDIAKHIKSDLGSIYTGSLVTKKIAGDGAISTNAAPSSFSSGYISYLMVAAAPVMDAGGRNGYPNAYGQLMTWRNGDSDVNYSYQIFKGALGSIHIRFAESSSTWAPWGQMLDSISFDPNLVLKNVYPALANNCLLKDSAGSFGGKITPGTGLQVDVSQFKAIIDGYLQALTAITPVNLSARKAALLYARKGAGLVPDLGRVDAVLPVADSGTVLRYTFSETGNPQDTSGNNNHAVLHGTVNRVDGIVDYAKQGDGSTGYYTATNMTGIPVGGQTRWVDVVFTYFSNGVNGGTLIGWGSYAETAEDSFNIMISYDNELQIVWNVAGTTMSRTRYYMEPGKSYLISVSFDGATIKTYVNGTLITSAPGTVNTPTGTLYVGKFGGAGTNYSKSILHYIEVRNSLRTDTEIALISNKLILPCSYQAISATYPINDISAGAHIYKFDDVTGTNVTDENGTLNGTAIGTSIINSEIGLSKARRFNGSGDYISLGNYAFPAEFSYIFVGKIEGLNEALISNRVTTSSGNAIVTDGNGKLIICNPTTNAISSKESVTLNIPVFIAVTVKSGLVTYYVNSSQPDSQQVFIPNTIGGVCYLGKDIPGMISQKGTHEYDCIIPRALTPAEIAQYYNALMVQKTRKIADDILPTDAIPLGFVQTDSSKVVQIDDQSYKFGRVEGIGYEGNKRVFLGWKYFNTSGTTEIPLSFSCPLGTDKVKFTVKCSKFLKPIRMLDVITYNLAGSKYYGANYSNTTSKNGDQYNVVIMAGGAAADENGWITEGYIGIFAEVLE